MWRYQYFKGEPNVRRPTPGARVTVLVSLSAILILVLSRLAGATTINANSASLSDVAAAIASAASGDIVSIPGGTVSWTRTLRVRKAITIQGAGVGVTIIKDDVQNGRLIDWTLVAGLPARLTGIEFQDGGRANTGLAPSGILHVAGSNTDGSTFRMDHCKWNNLNGYPVFETVIGVIDHNSFVRTSKQYTIYPYDSNWNNRSLGDGSWAAPTGFGSSQFLFLEDNDFANNGGGLLPIIDAFQGARVVIRHNTIHDGQIANHGTESTGRGRGGRAMEVYQNTFTGTDQNRIVGGARSGVVLFHDNSISGYWGGLATFTLGNWRNFYSFPPWGGADGTNPWDMNQPNAFFTGTAASNSSGTTVTVSGVNWAPNHWAGYTIRRTSDLCHSGGTSFGWIHGNTANTITYTDNGGYGGPALSFCTGDSLEIRKVDHALDQPGRALGSLVTGDPPRRPQGWNDQVTEPCYSWNNGGVNFGAGPGVRANVHYFNNTPMPGYTPYTYPHPLTASFPSQPTASATQRSQRYLNKRNERKTKKVKTWKWGRAKENSANETTERVAPDN